MGEHRQLVVALGMAPGATTDSGECDPLVLEWAQRLHSYALVVTRDPNAARDAVRDAVGTAVARMPGPTEETHIHSWLFALVRTESLRQLRARMMFIDTPGTVRVDDGDPFDGMTPGERDALALALRDELDPAAAARSMGCGVGVARSRVGAAQASWTEITRALIALRTPIALTSCNALADLAENSDGERGVLTRAQWRRVSDHARECSTCSPVVEPDVAVALRELAFPDRVASPQLTESVLAILADSTRQVQLAQRGGPWKPDGFPEPIERADHDPRSWARRAALLAAVSAALLMLGMIVLAIVQRR